MVIDKKLAIPVSEIRKLNKSERATYYFSMEAQGQVHQIERSADNNKQSDLTPLRITEQMFLDTLSDYEHLLRDFKKLEQEITKKDQEIAELTSKLAAVRDLVAWSD